MGFALDGILVEKFKGKMFHELSEEDQEVMEERYQIEDLKKVYGTQNSDILVLLKENCIDLSDNDNYFYVTSDVNALVLAAKQKVDETLKALDKYDLNSYGNNSDIYFWAEFLNAVSKYSKNENYYLQFEGGY